MKLTGTITALVTPFKNNELDKVGLRQNIRFQLENEIDGIVVLGTTGEAPTLTSEEEEIILRIAVEEIRGKVPLLVGTGTYSTEATIQNTKKAKELGADGALVISPYYNRPTQEGIYQHFATLTQKVPFPIYIYNNPIRTGANIKTETLEKIAALPYVFGVKETSGNILQIQEVLQKIGHGNKNFSVISGDDIFTYPLLALGGDGVISVASNLFPKEMKNLTQAATLEEAKEIHFSLLPLFEVLGLETNPIPIKTAMALSGMPAGPCRLPLCSMNGQNKAKLETFLKTYKPKMEVFV